MKNALVLASILAMFGYIAPSWSAASADKVTYQSYLVPEQHHEQFKEVRENNADNFQNALSRLQIVLLVDISYSMLNHDAYPFLKFNAAPPSKFAPKDNPTDLRWKRSDSAFLLASHLGDTMLKYDKDGNIPVYFFGSGVNKVMIQSAEQLYMAFTQNSPNELQTTNLDGALKTSFKDNVNSKDHVLFLVITDGKPDGKQEKIADRIYKGLSKHDHKGDRLNILFIQIGDNADATEFLVWLDEHNKKIKKNVDTKKDDYIYTKLAEEIILEAIFENQRQAQ